MIYGGLLAYEEVRFQFLLKVKVPKALRLKVPSFRFVVPQKLNGLLLQKILLEKGRGKSENP